MAANVGTWYGVTLDADALTGTFHSRIFDVLTGTQLPDDTQVIAGWTSSEANRDSIAFIGGEETGSTANHAVIDNVNLSSSLPGPSVLGF